MRHEDMPARLRLLAASLAVRSYQAGKGHKPTGLKQLVPEYLQRVPLDPFSGRHTVYRLEGSNWLLCRFGEGRRDWNKDEHDNPNNSAAAPGPCVGAVLALSEPD
jgi:hypothetical protein